jgi:hypothetical protein
LALVRRMKKGKSVKFEGSSFRLFALGAYNRSILDEASKCALASRSQARLLPSLI